MDLCVRHKEWQKFVDPCGDQQSRYRNVYYHCNIPCIQSRWPDFQPQMLDIHSTIAMQLLTCAYRVFDKANARKVRSLITPRACARGKVIGRVVVVVVVVSTKIAISQDVDV